RRKGASGSKDSGRCCCRSRASRLRASLPRRPRPAARPARWKRAPPLASDRADSESLDQPPVLIESAHRSRTHVFRAGVRTRGRAAAVGRHLAIVDALLVAAFAAEPLLARAGGSGHDERCPAIVARGFTPSREAAWHTSMR